MAIFDLSVSDEVVFGWFEDGLDFYYRFSRRTYAFHDDVEFLDSSMTFGSQRLDVFDSFPFDETVVGYAPIIHIQLEDNWDIEETGIDVAGRWHLLLVKDNLVFNDSVYKWIVELLVIDNWTFNEAPRSRFSIYHMPNLIDQFTINDSVIRIHELNKANIITIDSLVFNDIALFDTDPNAYEDNWIFVEVPDVWNTKHRPKLIENLVFGELRTVTKQKPPQGDGFNFREIICICLVLGRHLTDTWTFAEAGTAYIEGQIFVPGGPGGSGGFDFSTTWNRETYDSLQILESYRILKNEIDVFDRDCCNA